MNSIRSIAVALALFAGLSACNAILGNSEVTPTAPAENKTDPVGDDVDPRPGDDQSGESTPDAAPSPDASAPDASAPDASALDASAPDASAPDAGRLDAGPDAGQPDASRPDAGSCTLPEREEMSEDCGTCKTGKRTHKRIRKRTSACTWGEWEAWSSCEGPAEECKPDDVQTMMVPCGPCNTGKAVRKRSCSATTCTWGEYGSAGECTGITAACKPSDTTACTSGTCKNVNGDNTCPSCGRRVCQDNCTWGPCESKVAGGCLDDHWRCCGTARWQWCDPSSCNYWPCDSCQGDAECIGSCP